MAGCGWPWCSRSRWATIAAAIGAGRAWRFFLFRGIANGPTTPGSCRRVRRRLMAFWPTGPLQPSPPARRPGLAVAGLGKPASCWPGLCRRTQLGDRSKAFTRAVYSGETAGPSRSKSADQLARARDSPLVAPRIFANEAGASGQIAGLNVEYTGTAWASVSEIRPPAGRRPGWTGPRRCMSRAQDASPATAFDL